MPRKSKDPAAVALGRKGGLAKAKAMSKTQRRQHMLRMNRIRWDREFSERARAAGSDGTG